MRTDGLAKAFTAGGTIAPRRLVKPHTTAGQVVVATAAADRIIGASTEVAASTGNRVDVFLSGIAEVVYGGTVEAGQFVTADNEGRAVVAAPAANANARIAGTALVGGVVGDIGSVLLSPGSFQGAA